MLSWAIFAAIVAALGGCVVALFLRGGRHSSHPTGDHRGKPAAGPSDPLHRRATQYFASGALPGWDP